MEQYIKKSDLVAEIERKLKELSKRNHREQLQSDIVEQMVYNEMLFFINTLEIKETNLDKEIESYFKGFGKFPSVGIADCIDIAKHFFELGMKMAQKGEKI